MNIVKSALYLLFLLPTTVFMQAVWPLNIFDNIHQAAFKGDLERIRTLIAQGVDLNSRNQYSDTPLILAAGYGYTAVIEELLAHGADSNAMNTLGITALICASDRGHVAIVEKLLTHGADPNAMDKKGNAALIQASDKGHAAVVEKLLAHGADPNSNNKYGRNALDHALNCSVAQLLCDAFYNAHKLFSIPEKCCHISFEQNDWNLKITLDSMNALLDKIVVINSAHTLKNLIEKFPFIEKYFCSGKWSLFLNGACDLGVIVPAYLPDAQNLHDTYGLQNLKYIQPCDAARALRGLNIHVSDPQFGNLIEHFNALIDKNSPQHPTRFYLDGHGGANISIAAIPLAYTPNFLTVLADIGAELLFVNTCEVAGSNLVALQSHLQGAQSNDYAIVLQATSDLATRGTGNLNAFFVKLNDFLKDPSWHLGRNCGTSDSEQNTTITDVIAALGCIHVYALPSIRLPGPTSFFRPIDLGNMEIITASRLVEARAAKILRVRDSILNQNSAVSQKDVYALMGNVPQEIPIHVQSGTKYIQVLPCNLLDCALTIKDDGLPRCISKIPGQGQHFIGTVKYASLKEDLESALADFVKKGFADFCDSSVPAATTKCWFIKSLKLGVKGQTREIKNLMIKLDPAKTHYYPRDYFVAYTNLFKKSLGLTIKGRFKEIGNLRLQLDPVKPPCAYDCSFAYIGPSGSYMVNQAIVNQEKFKKTARDWFDASVATYDALHEATGGYECSYIPSERADLIAAHKIPANFESTADRALQQFFNRDAGYARLMCKSIPRSLVANGVCSVLAGISMNPFRHAPKS